MASEGRAALRVLVPNPLRCFKCQRFGHGSSTCRQSARCQQCGQTPHDGSECSAPKVCLSCGSSDHTVSSSQCPIWKEEKAICEVKAKSGVSYPEARRQVKATTATPTPGKSYAQAAKVQTASSSVQTDPIAALPPLQLLAPLKSTAVTTSNAATESMSLSRDVSPTPSADQPVSDSPAVAHPSRATVQRFSRPRTKVPKQGRLPPTASPSPRRGEQSSEHPPRPPVCISMGRSRSSSWTSPSRGGGPNHM